MSASRRKMAEFLAKVADFKWTDFIKAETDDSYTTSQSIVFSLIRACAMENLPAIKSAINRLDGKVETPVQVLMPKVYYLYPNATEALRNTVIEEEQALQVIEVEVDLDPVLETPTKGFRETLARMADYPRETPKNIIEAQNQCEEYVRRGGPLWLPVPLVKAVVSAHILHMAQERNIDAMEEVMDNIDGRLVETIRMVGEDLYIMQFGTVAPPGAVKNEDGVWQVEATQAQKMWREKLGETSVKIIQDN